MAPQDEGWRFLTVCAIEAGFPVLGGGPHAG